MADAAFELEQLRRQVRELETERRELHVLLEVGISLASERDPRRILEALMERVAGVTGAEAGTIWVVDEQDRSLVPAVIRGGNQAALARMRLRWGEGIAGRVTEQGKGLLVADVQGDPAWARRFDSNTGFVTRSMMCAPLLAKGEPLGCIQLLNKRGGEFFTERDLHLLTAIGNQAGLLIQNSRLLERFQTLFMSMVEVLSATIDARDPYTAGHSHRVATYAVQIAEELGVSPEEMEYLRIAALLHDLGKIGIRDNVLLKPAALTDDEFAEIKRHPALGAEIIDRMEPKHYLKGVMLAARHHHEKLNGRGYPDGIAGADISLHARIIAVADVFDALVTDRPYKRGWPTARALDVLLSEKGEHFDPAVVDAFTRALARVEENQDREAKE